MYNAAIKVAALLVTVLCGCYHGEFNFLLVPITFSLLLYGIGAVIHPAEFTYTEVSSTNGSDPNAGCPSVCRMTASSERFCDCTGLSSDTNGTLIDGIIPTFDVSLRGTWASQLYTADVTATLYPIGFRFSNSFMLQEVELSIFFCTPWLIPRSGLTINIHRGIVFPAFISTTPIGSTTLTLESNCLSLKTIYITTSPTRDGNIYFIEFTNSVAVGGIYIGEVTFRDEVTQIQIGEYCCFNKNK